MRLGDLSVPVGAVYSFSGEVIDMTVGYSLLTILMLPAGIALSIITILRIRSGRIALSRWGKVLVIAGILLSQVILIAAMMPTSVYQAVRDTFIGQDTHSVTQIDPSIPADVEPTE